MNVIDWLAVWRTKRQIDAGIRADIFDAALDARDAGDWRSAWQMLEDVNLCQDVFGALRFITWKRPVRTLSGGPG